MKKNKAILADMTPPTIEEVLAKGNAYKESLQLYAAQFTKKTMGTQSMGTAGKSFALKAQKRKDLLSEIVPPDFDGDDFDDKMEGVENLAVIEILNTAIGDSIKDASRVCKTDGRSYANAFYGFLTGKRSPSPKHQTALEELKPFFKKSAAEKLPVEPTDPPKSDKV